MFGVKQFRTASLDGSIHSGTEQRLANEADKTGYNACLD